MDVTSLDGNGTGVAATVEREERHCSQGLLATTLLKKRKTVYNGFYLFYKKFGQIHIFITKLFFISLIITTNLIFESIKFLYFDFFFI